MLYLLQELSRKATDSFFLFELEWVGLDVLKKGFFISSKPGNFLEEHFIENDAK
jgi:hypothetical protein